MAHFMRRDEAAEAAVWHERNARGYDELIELWEIAQKAVHDHLGEDGVIRLQHSIVDQLDLKVHEMRRQREKHLSDNGRIVNAYALLPSELAQYRDDDDTSDLELDHDGRV